jgi:hypothetical protein
MKPNILNGITLNPLTYGVVRRNKEAIDKVATEGLSSQERTDAAMALLKLAAPDAPEDAFDAATPGAIMVAALAVYSGTFARPEDPAPENTSL